MSEIDVKAIRIDYPMPTRSSLKMDSELDVQAIRADYSMPDPASLRIVSDPEEDERVLREEENADIQRELDLEEAGLEDHEPERGLSCEDDAQRELERVLKTAEWEAGSVSIEIENHGFGIERKSFTEASAFVCALAEIYRDAWNGSAPFDGGVPAFDCDEVAAVEEALEAPEYEQLMALAFP